MTSDRQYAHYLERDHIVWTCDECGNGLDENANCEWCYDPDEDNDDE